MPSLDYLTGFNHRIGTLPTSEGGLGYVSGAGTKSVDTVTVRRTGGSSLKLVWATQDALFNKQLNNGAAVSYVAVVCYANFSTLPTSGSAFGLYAKTGGFDGVAYDAASGQWILVANGSATGSAFGPTAATGTWYRLEVGVDMSSATYTVDCRVGTADGAAAAAAQQTSATRTASPTGVLVSAGNRAATASGTAYVMDLAASVQSGDYPIGPVAVSGYSPNTVGTHNLDASTSSYFFKETAAPPGSAGTALTTSETTSYQVVDEVPLDSGTDAVKVTPSTAFSTIARVGTPQSAASTTVTIPTHAVGDLIIMHVFRSASNVAPTIPAGWTQLGTPSTQSGGTKGWVGVYYKIATATNDTSGTWTSATSLSVSVYTGAATPGSTTDATVSSGVSTALTYPSLTISDTAHSWLVLFSSSASTGANTTPTGLSVPTGYAEVATRGIYDSNGIRASNYAGQAITVSSELWGTVAYEIKAPSTTTQPTNTWYAEYNFTDETVQTSAPLAVRAIVAQELDTAVSSTWAAKLYDSAQGSNTEDVSSGTISTTTKTYVGKTFTAPPGGTVTDNQYGTGSTGADFGVTVAMVAQSISGYSGAITGVTLSVAKDGSPIDNLVCEIQTDSAGSPSGVVLASQSVAGSSLSASQADVTFTFGSAVSVSSGTTYWIVLRRSGVDGTNFYTWWTRSDDYAGGVPEQFTSSWGSSFTGDFRFKVATIQPWTLATLNGTRLRFGYTNAASGDPRLAAAMLETAFPPSSVVLPPLPFNVDFAVARSTSY